jgi:four helix bundle protein
MQDNPPPLPFRGLHVLDIAHQAVRELRPVVAKIRRADRDLGEQVRSALSSVVLNTAEGNGSAGGLRVARFNTALGSADESRNGLRLAVSWGYIESGEIERGDALLDRVGAMLYRLGARRQ